LRAAGCVFAEDEAALLESAASGDELEALIRRREAGEPLEVVLGWVEFCGLHIAIDPGVFVPRQRSVYLAKRAIRLAEPGDIVVDLCCGSGAIGAAVLAAVPEVEVYAADIDDAAVANARRNLEHVYQGDLFEALPTWLKGRVSILVVNAPYVPTGEIELMPPEARDFEPTVALDGGEDGVDVQRRVARGAGEWLTPGGTVLIETSRRQAYLTVEALTREGLSARVVRSKKRSATVVIGTSLRTE
jgi:release factor glutamine methyltransferase